MKDITINKSTSITNEEKNYKDTVSDKLQLEYMEQYQKENNITGKCLANTILWLNDMKKEYPTARAKAVLCLTNKEKENTTKYIIHMLVVIGDIFIEPSYEISSIKDRVYYETFQDLIKHTIRPPDTIESKAADKEVLKLFLNFLKVEEHINKSEVIECFDFQLDYYNKQKEYVNNKFMSLINNLVT